MQLITPRLILREMRETDAEVLWPHVASEPVRRYEAEAPLTYGEFRDAVLWMMEMQNAIRRQHFYFAMTLSGADAEPLGTLYIAIRSPEHRQAEIGYMLGPPYWNQGYTTEAAREVVRFGFEHLDMHRIYAADILHENIGSIRVAQKLGFRQEARFRQSRYYRGRWWDTLVYAQVQAEWRASQDA